MSRLIGENIFVTGGGQGVGAEVANTLVTQGARSATLVGRDHGKLERSAAPLREAGCEVLTISADLTDVDECFRSVAAAEERFGAIDIICNSAGSTKRGSILDTTPEDFDLIFATNVRSSFFIMQAALPKMIEQQSGVIISISSMLAHGGVPYLAAYSASKGALNTLTRNVANTVRHDRIRVHAINLGWTNTPAEHDVQTTVHNLSEDWVETEGAKQPFGRLVEAKDPANLCAFLASTDGEMLTGTLIDLEQWIVGTLDVR